MADLLSQSDWKEFGKAINDVTETFFNTDVIIKIYSENHVNHYLDNKGDIGSYTNYEIKGLGIFDSDSKALNERQSFGEMDLSEGYVLVNYKDLLALGLIDVTTHKPTIKSAIDEISFQGNNFKLIGDAQVGPIQDGDNGDGRYALFKLFFKREINEN